MGAALRMASAWGPRLPLPGQGQTASAGSALATLGAADLTVARTVEPHLDALAILAGARRRDPDAPEDATWGCMPRRDPDADSLRAEGPTAGS